MSSSFGEKWDAVFSPDKRYRYWLERDWSHPAGLLDLRPEECDGYSCRECDPYGCAYPPAVKPRTINFLLLNPSTADSFKNDPTVERCYQRAKSMGFDRLVVTNIFAFRATDPAVMRAAPEPVGEENDAYIIKAALKSELVVCGWGGSHGGYRARGMTVARILTELGVKLHALRICPNGHPAHPLYLPYSALPVRYIAFDINKLSDKM